jgi:hypothetical protein
MRPQTLKILVSGLIAVALFFGLDLPRFVVPDWTPLARTALDAAGQLASYAAMAGLALAAEPLTRDHPGPTSRP